MPNPIRLTAALDRGAFDDHALGDAPIGLLVTFAPPPPPEQAPHDPLGVALVIDRSGSMSGAPVAAAREAALGVVAALGAADGAAVVAFDDRIEIVVPGGRVDDALRRLAEREIPRLEARGSTALFEGWCEGARAAAALELAEPSRRSVIVLSDGQGNQGLVDPAAMRGHAEALATRSVRTTCVGIGAHYHAPQLAALATGGGGALHQASRPAEIVECVLGELERVRRVAARDARLVIDLPPGVRAEVLADRRVRRTHAGLEIDLGDCGATAVATALLLDADDRAALLGPIAVAVEWTDPADGARHRTSLSPACPAVDAGRDRATATAVAERWQAELARAAMAANDEDRYGDARRVIDDAQMRFDAFARGLPIAAEAHRVLRRVARRVERPWRSVNKKEMLVMANKLARSDLELRSDRAAPSIELLRQMAEGIEDDA